MRDRTAHGAIERLSRQLADVTSERDYLRERLRELVAEWRTHTASPCRQGCAEVIEEIVNEAEGGSNETATWEVHNGVDETT